MTTRTELDRTAETRSEDPQVSERLKAERIQERLKAERIQERLKAERIQEPLEAARVRERLAELAGWSPSRNGQALQKTFLFPTLRAAGLFVQLVYELGEAAGFVPAIDARYLEVTLRVSTRRGTGVTDLDFDIAHLFQLTPGGAS
jgi:pterin-4a-carbinolamine dehydratase